MIYDIVDDSLEKIGNNIDIIECETLLYNLFEIEYDDKESLGKKLRELFSLQGFEIGSFIDVNDISYATLIMISRQIDPEFWTNQTMRMINTRHKKLLEELDSNGNVKPHNKIRNKVESKLILKRYFDLLPEELDHDEELSKMLISVMRSDDQLSELMEYTGINAHTLLSIGFDLSPKFWSSNSGNKLLSKVIEFDLP